MPSYIVSTGSALPEKKVLNEELLQFPKASLPLIKAKTGVESRYRCSDDERTSTLALKAAKKCIEKIGFDVSKIDAVVLASSTADRSIPATAAKVANELGAHNAFAFDVNSVCSGSVFLLEVGRSLLESGAAKNVILIAADAYSKILDPTNFSTFPYFGDGAGAVLLSSETSGIQVLGAILKTDGSGYETVTVKAGMGEIPISKIQDNKDIYFKMDGRAVFEFAVTKGSEIIDSVIEKFDVKKSDISVVIPHQANINIVNSLSEKTGIDRAKFFTNLQRVGNTASASVLLALDEYLSSASPVKNSFGVLASFGGGLSWAGAILKF